MTDPGISNCGSDLEVALLHFVGSSKIYKYRYFDEFTKLKGTGVKRSKSRKCPKAEAADGIVMLSVWQQSHVKVLDGKNR